MAFITIYVPCSDEAEARKISSELIAKRLVACANIFPIGSLYHWNGSLQDDREQVCLMKTTTANWEIVQEQVLALHSYETPCIMRWTVEANAAYEAWIASQVNGK